MADTLYPKFKKNLLWANTDIGNLDGATNVRIALVAGVQAGDVTTAITYDAADETWADLTSQAIGLANNAQAISNGVVSIHTLTDVALNTANGVFDASNVTFTTVAAFDGGGGAGTGVANAVVIFLEGGTAAASPLIAWLDDAGTAITGLAVTPNDTDINLNFSDSGIFEL